MALILTTAVVALIVAFFDVDPPDRPDVVPA